ncbi:hypothetical protein TREMEDRAFT_65333 [Tremella mesenterica DSM 1558]|uniref:uncharacterized protein n=1 Tax=Tremella mesenterica (strain ATCC 24925 / CBS 8224 / DSM 1558 / NBRC 9311 / NRRL Y-6157 / RJB 2259-6 / UBC 559-6) TaxID=578456 RepID=UPI00032CA1CF|nr:uncharacterized protein TREMEDRAFT_65333 [Tremella mesenterica DSM 1558]EIW66471.1 hypothetical protein TREMEDRAFT_65333 [Tremella mesenterica DSM 1558]
MTTSRRSTAYSSPDDAIDDKIRGLTKGSGSSPPVYQMLASTLSICFSKPGSAVWRTSRDTGALREWVAQYAPCSETEGQKEIVSHMKDFLNHHTVQTSNPVKTGEARSKVVYTKTGKHFIATGRWIWNRESSAGVSMIRSLQLIPTGPLENYNTNRMLATTKTAGMAMSTAATKENRIIKIEEAS